MRVFEHAATMAVACLAVVTLMAVSSLMTSSDAHVQLLQARAHIQQLANGGKEINTYTGWLKTLSKKPEWDKDWESQNMRHVDLTDLTPGALPHNEQVGSMQGPDFAKDVDEPSLAGPGSTPWETIPKKLSQFKHVVDAEEVMYNKLKNILDAHAKPAPEALVVKVAERGPVGPPGPRGSRGDMGDMGNQGPAGPPGPPGDEGPRGTRGPIGPQGLKGFVGAPGKRGFEGRVGKRGTMGGQGPKGKKGDTGMPGDAGPPGPQGDNGQRGEDGPRGPDGNRGRPGHSRTKFLISRQKRPQ